VVRTKVQQKSRLFKPDQDSESPIIAGDTSMTNTPKTLGNSTLQVGRIGLGCMGMSEFYGGTRDEADHIKTLHTAIDLGINLFDTADMYGVGHNEELVSKAFSDRWDKVTVATKFGVRRGANGEWLGISGRPEYVKEACEKSLKRLGLETIDLYYQHRPDPNVPVEESVGAMKELVEEGKVRFIGLSEFSTEQIRAAHAVHPITALQTEYSLWTRNVEAGILEACRDLGIAFVAYAPLGRGFLTGAIPNREALDANDWRRENPRFSDEALAENARFVELIRDIAAQKGATEAQVALAWVLAQGEDIFMIPGTRRIERLKENLGAWKVQFTAAELAEIRSRLPQETAGSRY
jgi:aryl-alcohol dehydrogenase-like predicted oxidoreductase